MVCTQKVQNELLIVGDVEALDIQLRENVEGGLRLDGAETGNVVEGVCNQLPLLITPAAGENVQLRLTAVQGLRRVRPAI